MFTGDTKWVHYETRVLSATCLLVNWLGGLKGDDDDDDDDDDDNDEDDDDDDDYDADDNGDSDDDNYINCFWRRGKIHRVRISI